MRIKSKKIYLRAREVILPSKLETQCVYSSEKMDVEIIFNQTSMTNKKSYGWKLWPDEIKRKHNIYPEH